MNFNIICQLPKILCSKSNLSTHLVGCTQKGHLLYTVFSTFREVTIEKGDIQRDREKEKRKKRRRERERERERCSKEMMSSSQVLKAAPSNGGPVHCHQSWDKTSKCVCVCVLERERDPFSFQCCVQEFTQKICL